MLAKRKLKQESTEVMLGEREEVSADLLAAQMQGYKNEMMRHSQGKLPGNHNLMMQDPRVRERPASSSMEIEHLDRETYDLRLQAGGGIPAGSIAAHERNWQHTVSSLFSIFL